MHKPISLILLTTLFVGLFSACAGNTAAPSSTEATNTEVTNTKAAAATIVLPTDTHTPVPPTATATATPSPTPRLFTSCADPELLSDVQTAFETASGLTVSDAWDTLKAAGLIKSAGDWTDSPSLFSYHAMYLGHRTISLAHLPNAQPGDQMVCNYAAVKSGGELDVLPLMAGFVYQGAYYPLATLIDTQDMSMFQNENPQTAIQDLEDWLDMRLTYGSQMHLLIETFFSVNSTEDMDFTQSGAILFDALNNDYLVRMSAVNSTIPHDLLGALDISLNDPGMMATWQEIDQRETLP